MTTHVLVMRPRLAAIVACALVACGTPGPWSPDEVQLSLFGDRKCSDPVLGQLAMHCCTGDPEAPHPYRFGHDNCYAAGGTEQDRLACDLEFAACMAIAGVPEEIIDARYEAVRRFGKGSFAYREHRTRGPGR